jgi:DNA-binding transcriptional LysR family regulator
VSEPRISLDQWQALLAVVEAGGYAQAAERLHKTQSTVSYAIKKIEHQLGIELFRIEGRKAVLTQSGGVLYRRGRALVDEAARLEQAAASLAAGWEAELRAAVETLFPTWLLLECIAQFGDEHPQTHIELYESVLDGTNELLMEGRVDLAVTSLVPPGFLGDPLMQVRAIAVVRDTGRLRTRTPGWQAAEQRTTVSHKATSIRAACMGQGFAWYAEEIIREELKSGELKPLPLAEGAERWGTLYLVYPDSDTARPGARRFGELIREATLGCPGAVAPAP